MWVADNGLTLDRSIRMLSDDILEVLSKHHPNPPALPTEIEAFERRMGMRLDPELRAFYEAANGARLFRTFGSPIEILPLNLVRNGVTAIRGARENAKHYGAGMAVPDNIWAFVDVQDGNFLGFDASADGRPFPIVDLFHETWPVDQRVIEPSFAAFLHHALRSGGSQYWLANMNPES